MIGQLGTLVFYAGWPIFQLYSLFRRSARVVIVNDGAYLMAKPLLSSGRWLLPGGGARRGETAKQTAVREIREETGISLDEDSLEDLGMYWQRQRCLFSKAHVFYYRIPTRPPTKRQRHEIRDIGWQPLSVIAQNAGNPTLSALITRRHLQ